MTLEQFEKEREIVCNQMGEKYNPIDYVEVVKEKKVKEEKKQKEEVKDAQS